MRSSPQRRKAWLKEVANTFDGTPNQPGPLMLILDVKTRWSSTHEMLSKCLYFQSYFEFSDLSGRAIIYRLVIDAFVARHREIRKYDLSDDDWSAIVMASDWLKAFRSATTLMSTSKQPMLSTTFAIFRGLQEHLRETLATLPDDISSKLKEGLLGAHLKLSDYYHKIDESYYYTWAARRFSYLQSTNH